MSRSGCPTVVLAACITACFVLFGVAQEAPKIITGPGGQRMIVGPDGKPRPIPGRRGERPNDEKKKEGDDKTEGKDKKDGKGDDKKEDDVLKRPDAPLVEPDPNELKVLPDEKGELTFNFRYQRWPDVLEWLARVSGKSLDWRELPKDYLNLRTQRAYTVPETRDLVNRHLLLRGFTLLEDGEILSVANISKIDPGMVPRVQPDELETRLPHEFVRVSFPLDWLLAADVVEELKTMLSPNHKLSALKSVNRIEAMDAVANLREVHRVLLESQGETGKERLIEVFVMKHARATEVLASIEGLLGIESKTSSGGSGGGRGGMDPRMMQQMMQMMQQMQRGNKGGGGGGSGKKGDDVTLVINPRKNSILAHAPPDKMAIIREAVHALDVESDRTDDLLSGPFQIRIYRLHSIAPEPLVNTLEEVGDLDPRTRLEVDEGTKTILAVAPLIDHGRISELIERLDSTGRQFEIVHLKRHPADQVAGTIEFMMVGEKDKNNRSRYDYYYYRYGPGSRETGDEDEFRVDADVRNNTLILWANEVELEAVNALLVKIGERAPAGGRMTTTRTLEVPLEDAAEFLEKLERAWTGPNKLNIPKLPKPAPEESDSPSAPATESPAPKEARTIDDRVDTVAVALLTTEPKPEVEPAPAKAADASPQATDAAARPEPATPAEQAKPADAPELQADSLEDEADRRVAPEDAEDIIRRFRERAMRDAREEAAPINITIGPTGKLVITCDDPVALDQLQELMESLAPPKREFEIFHLKFADAYYVTLNLEEYFTEKKDDKNNNSRFYFYDDYYGNNNEDSKFRLSQRPELKFIWDLDSNSILVQGADDAQLRTVKQLIEIYDKKPDDAQLARLSQMFQVKYSKAKVIADAVKDVYRDLLSANDKALQQGQQQQKQTRPPGDTYIFNDGGGDSPPDRTQVSFKGKVSIGVDELSNTLLVSAQGETLMHNIGEMIRELDEAAKPLSTVSVVELSGRSNAQRIREVLKGVLADSQSAGDAEQPQQPGQPQQGEGGNRGGNFNGQNRNFGGPRR